MLHSCVDANGAARVYEQIAHSRSTALKRAKMDLVVLLVCMETGISDRDSFNVRISELFGTEKENENVQARVHLSFERCIRQRAPAGFSKAVLKLLGQSSPCDFAPAIATDDSDE